VNISSCHSGKRKDSFRLTRFINDAIIDSCRVTNESLEVIYLKQITLRGIPLEIERMIKREAEKKGLSLNKAFISLLEKTAGAKGNMRKGKPLHHDLDHLYGIWTRSEAEEFTRNVEFQRKIDEDLWKTTGS